jgi:hypothetical protein
MACGRRKPKASTKVPAVNTTRTGRGRLRGGKRKK